MAPSSCRPDHAHAAHAEHHERLVRHLFPRFTGTIYEILSAPVSGIEIALGYVGAAATKSIILGLIILATSFLFVPLHIAIVLDGGVPGADRFHLQSARLHHRHLAEGFEQLQIVPLLIITR